jgi:hypothetical protein
MAFKMKGSAFKLGNVATKSALKQGQALEKETREKTERSAEDKAAMRGKAEPKVEKTKPRGPKLEKLTRKEDPSQWKGPLPQKTKFTDKLKAFGTAITSKQGLMTPGNAAIKKAYSKYKREKKKYRDADRKSEMNK